MLRLFGGYRKIHVSECHLVKITAVVNRLSLDNCCVSNHCSCIKGHKCATNLCNHGHCIKKGLADVQWFCHEGYNGVFCTDEMKVEEEKLKFIKTPTDQLIEPGERIILECQVNDDTADYMWFYEDLMLQTEKNSVTVLPGGVLDISEFSRTLEGLYKCLASTSSDFLEHEFRLSLAEPCDISVEVPPMDTVVEESSVVLISCYSQQAVNVTWYKDAILIADTMKYERSTNHKKHDTRYWCRDPCHRSAVTRLINKTKERISQDDIGHEELSTVADNLTKKRNLLESLDSQISDGTELIDMEQEILDAADYAMNMEVAIRRFKDIVFGNKTTPFQQTVSEKTYVPIANTLDSSNFPSTSIANHNSNHSENVFSVDNYSVYTNANPTTATNFYHKPPKLDLPNLTGD
ncbi:coagulation factor II (thrombin) [Mytilus galloprovincialis]|uniref:Coagulation factor II (Thrombin) n=1 Tax=Mytilus galloprovincialis TaxID=29158 RepID=A0A8B6H5V8_MYTGA|nr:coagulation factor II (thrombin) [Mytilus galloprovincialis]